MKRRWIGLMVILAAAAVLTVAGYLHLEHAKIYPSTDDAYVGGSVLPVASRVGGTLVEVLVEENSNAKQGEVVARLDPRDFDAAVARAEAMLAKAEATVEQDRAHIAQAQAAIVVARAEAEQAQVDLQRYTSLQTRGSTPERQAEEARTNASVANAKVTAAEKALGAARSKLDSDQKDADRYRAELVNAQLQRSYCTIVAPTDGMVADKSAEIGQVVAPGQPLCRIVPLRGGDIWVDANFKETQLRRIEPGQPVTVEVDAIADHQFRGTVEALSAGTGGAFALLPPENASGNWVKIVQRLPVRIQLEDGDPQLARLRLGLSARVTVDTRAESKR